jgi:hypothetical protein
MSPLISQNVKTTCKTGTERIFFSSPPPREENYENGKIKTNYLSWKSHTLAKDKHFLRDVCKANLFIYDQFM